MSNTVVRAGRNFFFALFLVDFQPFSSLLSLFSLFSLFFSSSLSRAKKKRGSELRLGVGGC